MMDLTTFVRKWGSRVSYVRLPGEPMQVVPSLEAPLVLPSELAASWAEVDLRTASTRHIPLFSDDLKIGSESHPRYWVYDENNILNATMNDKPIEKFSWDPLEGEFLLVPPGQNHASMKGSKPFDDYVRAVVLHKLKKVTFRPFWPTWQQKRNPAIDEVAQDVSFAAQEACEKMLMRHGAQGWGFEFNINNVKLEEMTGIYRKRW